MYEHDAGRPAGRAGRRRGPPAARAGSTPRAAASRPAASTAASPATDVDAEGRSATRTGPDGGDRALAARRRPAGSPPTRSTAGAALAFDYDGDGPFPTRLTGPDGWEMRVDGGRRPGPVGLTDADGVTARFDHDADGNVVAATNGVGATTRTEPHVSGEATAVTLPDGATIAIERDDAGRLLALRTPTGDEFTVEWSPAGRLAAHRRARRRPHDLRARQPRRRRADRRRRWAPRSSCRTTTWSGWSAWRRPAGPSGGSPTPRWACCRWSTTPAGGPWGYDYDAEGRLVAATDPLGHRSPHALRRGRAAGRGGRPDGQRHPLRPRRPGPGRPQATGPDGGVDHLRRGTPGAARGGSSCPTAARSTYTYTPAGRVRSVRTAEGRGLDRRLRRRRPAGVGDRRRRRHHPLRVGRLRPAGSATTPGRAGRALRLRRRRPGRSRPSADGARWRAAYDHAGRVTALTDPAGATTPLRATTCGASWSPPPTRSGRQRAPALRRAGQPGRGVIDPLGGLVTTAYDAMRRPVATTDQLGRTTRLDRDAAGRVVRQELPTGDVVEWRARRRGPGHRHPGQRARRRRVRPRPAGRPGARPRAGPQPYVHPGLDPRADAWPPLDVDGATTALGARPATAGWSPATTRRAAPPPTPGTRPAGSRRCRPTAGAGSSSTATPDGRLVALRAGGVDAPLGPRRRRPRRRLPRGRARAVRARRRCGRDAAGRVVEVGDGRGTTRYRYDAAGQLVGAAGPAGAWAWHYDPAGRLAREEGPAGTTTYDYDEAHQLVRADGPGGHDAATATTPPGGAPTSPAPPACAGYAWDARGDLDRRRARRRPPPRRWTSTPSACSPRYGDTPSAGTRPTPVPPLIAIGDRRVVGPPGQPLALAAPDGTVTPLRADWRGSIVADGTATDPWGARLAPADGPDQTGGTAGPAGGHPDGADQTDGTAGPADGDADVPHLGPFGELDLGEPHVAAPPPLRPRDPQLPRPRSPARASPACRSPPTPTTTPATTRSGSSIRSASSPCRSSSTTTSAAARPASSGATSPSPPSPSGRSSSPAARSS